MTFDQVMTIVAVVGTGIGTTVVQIYREHRNRKWEREDREEKRKELAAQLALTQRTVAATAKEAKDLIVRKIDENTLISQLAFDAANNFHTKAAKLEYAFDRVLSHGQLDDRLPSIQQTVEDTNSRVRDVEAAIHKDEGPQG